MRTTLGSFLRKVPDHYRSFQRGKTTVKNFVGDFLAQDAALAANTAAMQVEWAREFLKGCPAVAAAITPLHHGGMQLLRQLQPKESKGGSPMVDIDTLAAVFGGGGGNAGLGAGMAGARGGR